MGRVGEWMGKADYEGGWDNRGRVGGIGGVCGIGYLKEVRGEEVRKGMGFGGGE